MATEAKTKKTNSTKKSTTKKVTKKPTVKKATSTTKTVPKTTKKVTAKKDNSKVIQEENNYRNTIISAVIIALIFIVGIIVGHKSENQKDNENYKATADELKFEKAYESLNGTSDVKVEITNDNNIVYITMEEAATMLESGSGVIYFGYSANEYARTAVPVLIEAMSSSKLEKIYYVDMMPDNNEENDLRDSYTLSPKNRAKVVKKATTEYENVRMALANYLDDYVLYTEKGKKVNTGQKRLEAPTVVSVVEGQILGFHKGTVEEQEENKEGKLNALTKEQKKNLLDSYAKVISSQLNKKCTIEEGC